MIDASSGNFNKILVCGLPGAGKTTFVKYLKVYLDAYKCGYAWYNADRVREECNDWDFSMEGRERQAARMLNYSNHHKYFICDMVAPTEEIRKKYFSDFYVIWIDTIQAGRFYNTNAIFEAPNDYDLRIKDYNYENTLKKLAHDIIRTIK